MKEDKLENFKLSYVIPQSTYIISYTGWVVGKASQFFLSVPRPIRWHLASVAGAAGIACFVNAGLTMMDYHAKRSHSDRWLVPGYQYRRNQMIKAGIISEGIIYGVEKWDQYSTGQGKFDNVDFWGGTAAILFAVAAYKLSNWKRQAKRPPPTITPPQDLRYH